MLKRSVMIFTFVFLLFVNYIYAGSCDISNWVITNDDGSVASVVATIGGVSYDFVTRQYDSGVERVFYRTSSKTPGGPISQADAVTLVDLFLAQNKDKLGLQGYGNVKYDSISDNNYLILADDYIKVNPDTCEGINYITGNIYVGIDSDANINFINPRISLYFGLTNTPPSLNQSIAGGGVGAGSAGGAGGAGAAGSAGGAGGSKPSVNNTQNTTLEKIQTPAFENLNENKKFYKDNFLIIGLPIFLILIFISLLSFIIISLKKKS